MSASISLADPMCGKQKGPSHADVSNPLATAYPSTSDQTSPDRGTAIATIARIRA